MKSISYRSAVLFYVLMIFLLTFDYWADAQVISPHRQFSELALVDNSGSMLVENRKFSDFTSSYIPGISDHLTGSRSGWLTLWTDKNELGRPVNQISGLSPAYFLSWLIAQITDNPWRFITLLSLFTCFFTGIFLILFCREVGLSPLAGLIAGASLATSPSFMYWLTFPMFITVWCWSAGALWAVTRLARKPDLLGWSALAFSVYSLLMTGYPQTVVFHAYLIGGYGLYLIFLKQKRSFHEIVRFLALVVSALGVGIIFALPAYLDLAAISADSARVAPAPSFFTVVLLKFNNFLEFARFFVLSTVPEIFGNPITSGFPFSYDGLSVTLLVIFFAVIGLFAAFKDTWGWWLAIIVLCLFAFVHPLYTLGVKYLGFNISRSSPLGSIVLPITVIVAFGVDALVKRATPGKLSRLTLLASVCIIGVIAIGLIYGWSQAIPIRLGMVMVMLMVTALLAAQYDKTRPMLLIAALVILLMTISYPLMLRQDMRDIATTSPLVEQARKSLPDSSRFAVAAPGISALPPNLNAGLGLDSLHSYNSLSSRRYHTLIQALGGEVVTYGRWNAFVAPDYNGAMFWMSNISLVLG
jgi:hypothetical protein